MILEEIQYTLKPRIEKKMEGLYLYIWFIKAVNPNMNLYEKYTYELWHHILNQKLGNTVVCTLISFFL